MEEGIQRKTLQPVKEQNSQGLRRGEGHHSIHDLFVQRRDTQYSKIEGQKGHLDQPLAEDIHEFNDEEKLSDG